MKLSIFIITILLITSLKAFEYDQVQDMIDNALQEQIDSAFEDQASPETLEKANKCMTNGKEAIFELIDTGKNIAAENYSGLPSNIKNLFSNIKTMLETCGTLFCFSPTFEKCEADFGQGNCEKTGLVVYPKCREGFSNFGCCLCKQECPNGWRDDGLFCNKPAAYGRGAGYVLWQRSKCEAQNPQGCEKVGLIWYPKCQPGYHRVGCCICSPDCPSGWTDIGVSCAKPDTYGRGVGYPVSFGKKCLEEYDQKHGLQQSEDFCEGLKQQIKDLTEIVEIKYEITLHQPDRYQQGMADYIKALNQQSEIFTQQCAHIQYE